MARVGFFNADTGKGESWMARGIAAAGHEPINVAAPDADTLADLDVLIIDRDNTDAYKELSANTEAIEAAVANGLTLIFHDNSMMQVRRLVPGSEDWEFRKGFSGDETGIMSVRLDDEEHPIRDGKGGEFGKMPVELVAGLVGGAVMRDSLPEEAEVILTTDDPDEVVSFAYPYGDGRIIYSTIDMESHIDYWSHILPNADDVLTYYTNLIQWAVEVAEDDNIIWGTDENDVIVGSEGEDVIEPGYGDDTVHGMAGNDHIEGGWGNDWLAGGDGNDFIYGAGDNDEIYGDAGDDELRGGQGNDVVYGGTGDDAIIGGSGDDWMSGGEGNDVITGEDGVDQIYGDAGDDVIDGGNGDDWLSGGEGSDDVAGADGDDVVYGNAGDDTLDGGAGSDVIYGGTGNDHISGGEGDNALYGGAGNDVFYSNNPYGHDAVVGGLGSDTIDFQGHVADVSIDLSQGTAAIDGREIVSMTSIENVIGGAGNDAITGGRQDNIINGGAGDDWIRGKQGADTLTGGEGADTFTWARQDIVNRNGDHLGVDVITDFNAAEDTLDFRGLINMRRNTDISEVVSLEETDEGTIVSVDFGNRGGVQEIALLEDVFELDVGSLYQSDALFA